MDPLFHARGVPPGALTAGLAWLVTIVMGWAAAARKESRAIRGRAAGTSRAEPQPPSPQAISQGCEDGPAYGHFVFIDAA